MLYKYTSSLNLQNNFFYKMNNTQRTAVHYKLLHNIKFIPVPSAKRLPLLVISFVEL